MHIYDESANVFTGHIKHLFTRMKLKIDENLKLGRNKTFIKLLVETLRLDL